MTATASPSATPTYTTRFGSLARFEKGGVQPIATT